jgi:hypothetical protein
MNPSIIIFIFVGGYVFGLIMGFLLGLNNSPRKPDTSLLKYLDKPKPFVYINPYFPPQEKK